jgi:hypothetical protein
MPYAPGVGDPWYQERLRAASAKEGFFTSMLSQDMESLVPYRLAGRDFHLEVVGDQSQEVQEMVASALQEEIQGSRGIYSGVSHFLRRAAQLIVMCGPLAYEIDLVSADQNATAPSSFSLDLIMPGTLDSRWRRPIQYVPLDQEVPGQVVRKTRRGHPYVRLDPDLLVKIGLDSRSTQEAAIAVEALKEADRGQRVELEAMKAMERGEQLPRGLSFKARRETSDDLVAKYTVPLGWSARWALRSDRRDRLDTYLAWRNMRFVRFQIQVRNTIMDGINSALLVAGTHIGFSTQLNLTDVTTLEDVDHLKERFTAGTATLEEVASLQC